MKWGDPASLEDYSGGRDFETLKKFAETSLKPMCSPTNLKMRDEEKKAEINKLLSMNYDELDKENKAKETEMEKVEQEFKALVEGFQSLFHEKMKEKDDFLRRLRRLVLSA